VRNLQTDRSASRIPAPSGLRTRRPSRIHRRVVELKRRKDRRWVCGVAPRPWRRAHASHRRAGESDYSLWTRHNPEIAVLEECRNLGNQLVASVVGRGLEQETWESRAPQCCSTGHRQIFFEFTHARDSRVQTSRKNCRRIAPWRGSTSHRRTESGDVSGAVGAGWVVQAAFPNAGGHSRDDSGASMSENLVRHDSYVPPHARQLERYTPWEGPGAR